ncbi:MAG: hypothetical protein RIC16_11765 [Rhodospirillales bacterium]
MFRIATLISMATGALLAVFVFAIKYEVQDLEAEFSRLSRSIERERQAIHVLTAEWSHLNEPARLRALARDQLGLDQISVDRLRALDRVPLRAVPELIGDPEDENNAGTALAAAPSPTPATPRVAAKVPSPDDGLARIEAALREMSPGGPPE